jgi:ribosomal protein S18 acetylase RimI-like enzyme
MILVRDFREMDGPAVLNLARELQAHEATLFERMKPPEQIGPWYLGRLLRDCSEKQGALIVADDNGTVIGYATVLIEAPAAITETDYRYARVGDLIVNAQARGRGIGGALLAECERRARAAGVDELRLDVLAANQQARDTYATLGFEELHVTVRKSFRRESG